jgi:hypothetical protein
MVMVGLSRVYLAKDVFSRVDSNTPYPSYPYHPYHPSYLSYSLFKRAHRTV